MEFSRFCPIAIGSASELEYHLLLGRDLGLIKPKDLAPFVRPISSGIWLVLLAARDPDFRDGLFSTLARFADFLAVAAFRPISGSRRIGTPALNSP
jgi:hypothetical protein